MRETLMGSAVPAAARERHERMLATLNGQIGRLTELVAARELDTEAVDAEIARTFEIEKTVGELFTLPAGSAKTAHSQ